MILTPQQLAAIMACPLQRAAEWVGVINTTIARYEINTHTRAAMWLAQIGHESASLARVEENLNYTTPARLQQIFPRHFPSLDMAAKYAGKPEWIGARVYANRLGNGPEQGGEGWRYRGRGLIQVTGKVNYAEMAHLLVLPLVGQPELLTLPQNAALSAGAFWNARGLNRFADAGQFEQTTRIINGGLHGQTDRVARFKRALTHLR
jgi:putative chitinase